MSARPKRVDFAGALLAVLVCLSGQSMAGNEIVGLALVQDDGTLLIKGHSVVLYGIHLPPSGRDCRDWIGPVRCGPRAVLALEAKVKGFIRCDRRLTDVDGRIHAVCHVGRTGLDPGEDLGAYLARNGWALALPNAPFEYHALERIARSRGLGVWGAYGLD